MLGHRSVGRNPEDALPLKPSAAIEVKRIKGKGRGVFARRRIRRGEVIERVPVIVLPSEGQR